MRTSYLDRETSDAIKGIALLFMFIHHFFTFPDWYASGISYPELTLFARLFCWPLMILAAALGYYRGDLPGVVGELFALDGQIMTFGWYVYFYCITMLLLPIAAKFSRNSFGRDVLLLLVFPVAVFVGMQGIIEDKLGTAGSALADIMINMRDWFPCVISGFLCAKYSVFERFLDEISGKLRSKYMRVLAWLLLAGAACMGRSVWPRFSLGSIQVAGEWLELIFSMDIFYAPLFVYGIAKLWQFLKGSVLSKILGCLGKQSLLMWFLHCVFFNVYAEVTQPILYAPKNPILVLLFGLILCYIPAVFIDRLVKPVQKLKNKYL